MLLRSIAGLWSRGRGSISRPSLNDLLFLPQRPYMVLGSLRQQLLYPRSCVGVGGNKQNESQGNESSEVTANASASSSLRRRRHSRRSSGSSPIDTNSSPRSSSSSNTLPMPTDEQLAHVLQLVNLSHLLSYNDNKRNAVANGTSSSSSSPLSGLDTVCDWSEVLSLGESQRVSFARIFLTQPLYVFADESTAALDATNEERLYNSLALYAFNTCLVSVGHRPALLKHHSHVLHIKTNGQWKILEINEKNKKEIDKISEVSALN